jgi:hypothetical protein
MSFIINNEPYSECCKNPCIGRVIEDILRRSYGYKKVEYHGGLECTYYTEINKKANIWKYSGIEKGESLTQYFLKGILHRNDGPAYISDNIQIWYKHGKVSRVDGPAYINRDGDKFWIYENQLHRLDGPAVELINGDRYWYQYNLLHREEGPAIVCSRDIYNKYRNESWYCKGVTHNPKYVKTSTKVKIE